MQNKVASNVLGNADLIKVMHRKTNKGQKTLQTDDLMVSLYSPKRGGQFNQIAFTFEDGFFEMICGDLPYLAVAPWHGRLYFIPTEDLQYGFNAYRTNDKCKKRQFKFSPDNQEELDIYKPFVGNHSFSFSEDRQLYFIGESEVKA